MDEVYFVEVVATGGAGFPVDRVVEVAVCRMNKDGSDYDTVYHNAIAMDPRDLGKDVLDRLTDNFGFTPEELYAGEHELMVVSDVQEILFGNECASYDMRYTFGRFLSVEPWDLTHNVTIMPGLSMRLPPEFRGSPEKGRMPLKEAYNALCPGDPAQVGEGRRAIHMAQMSASVAMELRKRGMY